MKRRLYLLAVSLLSISWLFGQSQELERLRDEIAFNADNAVNAQLDKHRIRSNERLVTLIDSFLLDTGSYAVSMDSIPWLSVLHGADFRLVTWQLRISDNEHKYSGFLQWADRVVWFKDKRPFINGSEYSIYTPSGWYGCLYYSIIPFESGGVKYYTLLGYNAEDRLISTKVADILDLSGDEPRLGLPVFIGNGEAKTRLLMTYGDISPARMLYDPQLQGIVHDHTESLPGIGPEGEALPVSDGSMEAWILQKGKWVYKEELYDEVKLTEPPFTDERKDRKEDKDILGRPKKE
ncbi:MAG: hypothetical protein SH808_15305 [Saprospiraceae bacterium]|nr:hypothetical protein [Saprospiraceae bacterium]